MRDLAKPKMVDKYILAFNQIAISNFKYKNELRVMIAAVVENDKNANNTQYLIGEHVAMTFW